MKRHGPRTLCAGKLASESEGGAKVLSEKQKLRDFNISRARNVERRKMIQVRNPGLYKEWKITGQRLQRGKIKLKSLFLLLIDLRYNLNNRATMH